MAQTNIASTVNARKLSIPSLVNSIETLYFGTLLLFILCTVSSLPISQLCVGIIYLNQCPIQQQIPKWLIVSGCRGLFCIILVIYVHHCCKHDAYLIPMIGSMLITMISLFFNIAWSIVGIVWASSIRSVVQHGDVTQSTTYCHSTPYIFETAMSIYHLIIIGIPIIIVFLYKIIVCLDYIIGCLYDRPKTLETPNDLDTKAANKPNKEYLLLVMSSIMCIILCT